MANLAKTLLERRRHKKLATQRQETLSAIRGELLNFETMVQRAQQAGDTPPDTLLTSVRERLAEITQQTNQEADIDELEELIEDAEQQGQLRAYICPPGEIRAEGTLAIDLLEEWNVPKTAT
jgi:hypothetical protein